MNEPVTKSRPQINVDEFERYLRETTKVPHSPEDDPLAELARLVSDSRDPYGEVFSRGTEVNFGRTSPDQRRQAIDFATIEAGLRGSLPGHGPEPDHAAFYQQQAYPGQQQAYPGADQNYYEPQGAISHDAQNWREPAQAPSYYPARRSRRPVYVMAAVILLGVTGIGFAFFHKGSNSGPREIAMIKAVPGPSKIQPPADDTADQTNHDGGILDNSQQPAPTKTVTHEEQPVDLAQSVQNAPRDTSGGLAASGIEPIYNFGGARPEGDGNSPSSAAAAQASQPSEPAVSAIASNDGRGIASDIQPIRVKTRSYRPDGTPIPDDHIPAAAIDAAVAETPAPKAGTAAVPKASTPKSVTAAKTTTRAASIAKPKPPVPKPVVTASRDVDAPTDLNPPIAGAPLTASRPLRTAEATPDDLSQTGTLRAAAASNGFAVQLAAPATEAEARQTSSRLERKFASELGGRRLSTVKAESNGRTVYRLRVGSMSREEAVGLCEKLKTSGGSCFIAKN